MNWCRPGPSGSLTIRLATAAAAASAAPMAAVLVPVPGRVVVVSVVTVGIRSDRSYLTIPYLVFSFRNVSYQIVPYCSASHRAVPKVFYHTMYAYLLTF
jgi:hypothetical protein